jgi:hypothetical protein
VRRRGCGDLPWSEADGIEFRIMNSLLQIVGDRNEQTAK